MIKRGYATGLAAILLVLAVLGITAAIANASDGTPTPLHLWTMPPPPKHSDWMQSPECVSWDKARQAVATAPTSSACPWPAYISKAEWLLIIDAVQPKRTELAPTPTRFQYPYPTATIPVLEVPRAPAPTPAPGSGFDPVWLLVCGGLVGGALVGGSLVALGVYVGRNGIDPR
jgi:hypothetical protein